MNTLCRTALAMIVPFHAPLFAQGGRTLPTPPAWQIVPDSRIDGSRVELEPAAFALADSRGGVFIGQFQSRSVVHFTADGARRTVVGRDGSGPGEFRLPTAAGWLGDSLWVYDGSLKRVALFAPDRKYARSFTLSAVDVPAWGGDSIAALALSQVVALDPDGSVLAAVIVRSTAAPTQRDGIDQGAPMWLVRLSVKRDGRATVTAVVARIPEIPRTYVKYTLGSSASATVPFLPSRIYAVHPSGGIIAMVGMTYGPGGTVTVSVHALRSSGDTIWRRNYPVDGDPIAASAVDSALRSSAAREPRARELYETAIRDQVPRVHAPVTAVRVGRDGFVWLRLNPATTPAHHRWIVFDPSGTPVGAVTVPRQVGISDADADNIWAFDTDADGVPSIQRFRIQRR